MNYQVDKEITVFSNQGKLYQIEYAFNAVKNSGFTSVGVRGNDVVVVVTQKKIADKAIVPSSVTRIFKVTERIGALFTGSITDAKILLSRLRQEAGDYKYENGHDMPINVLADKIGELSQLYTQHAYMRPLCVMTILFSIDEERGPQLFKVDPAGHYTGFKATASGEKEQSANGNLEKIFNKKPELTRDETFRIAIHALQETLSSEFRASDIEVAYAFLNPRQEAKIAFLTETEIDNLLEKVNKSD